MAQFKVTTTGIPTTVVLNDLGGRTLIHPVVDLDLLLEFSAEELSSSADLQAAITGSQITATDVNNNAIGTVTDATSVPATTDELAEGATNQYYTEARVSANTSVTANSAKVSADGSVTTHSDVTSAGSGSIITAGERTLVGSATQPGDNISTLTNDAGFVDSSGASAAAPVQSVNGQTGVVSVDADDIPDAATSNKFSTQAQLDKIDFISITQAVNLDNIESNVSTNNAKVSADGSVDTHSDVDTVSTAPTNNDVLTWNGTMWVPAAPPGAGGGEANTASNAGVGGVGVFRQKTGTNLEFKNINAAASRVVITDDVANAEIDIDIDPSQVSVGDLGDVDTSTSAPVQDDLIVFDGTNWVPLSQREEGNVKANSVVTSTLITNGTKFKITAAAPLTFSSASRFPLTISNQFPGQTPTGDPATFTPFMYDTATGKWIENPKDLQGHLWRVNVNYTRSGTQANREIIFELSNPLSSFVEQTAFVMPNGGAFSTFEVTFLVYTIADSASIGFGYEMFLTPEGENITINDVSITRASLAVL